MNIEFLGTAGYHPSQTRHTSCAVISDAAPNAHFMLDAGTGLMRLIGRDLPAHIDIFLSHAHLDHSFGLTFYLDLLYASTTPCELTLYGARKYLDAVLGIFNSPLFPVAFKGESVALEAGETLDVRGVKVSAFPLLHPGGALGFRFDWPQKSLAYVTDTSGEGDYSESIRGVDLLVHERNFPDECHELARLSGHCTSADALRAFQQSQARQLVLMHFNPLAHGDPLDEDDLRQKCPGVIAAHDGLIIEF